MQLYGIACLTILSKSHNDNNCIIASNSSCLQGGQRLLDFYRAIH
jgi:hypothetical protein